MVEKQDIPKNSSFMKNTQNIARAIIENNKKFKVIDELYRKHKDSFLKKEDIMSKIMNVYKLGFKGISKKKKPVGIINGIPYHISKNGIGRPSKYKGTADLYKAFIFKEQISEELFNIGQNLGYLKKSMNKHQRKIFTDFFKDYKLLRDEPLVLLKWNKVLRLLEINSGFSQPYNFRKIDSISFSSAGAGDFDFNFFKEGKIILNIRFSRLYLASGLNEKIYIEQTFSYITTLLKKEIKNREKEIKRLNTFYSRIKEKFRDFIMLGKSVV